MPLNVKLSDDFVARKAKLRAPAITTNRTAKISWWELIGMAVVAFVIVCGSAKLIDLSEREYRIVCQEGCKP